MLCWNLLGSSGLLSINCPRLIVWHLTINAALSLTTTQCQHIGFTALRQVDLSFGWVTISYAQWRDWEQRPGPFLPKSHWRWQIAINHTRQLESVSGSKQGSLIMPLSARGVSGCQDVWPLIDSNRQCSGQLEGLARGFPKGMEKWEREPPGEIPKIFKGTSSHHIPSPPQNLPQKSFTDEVTEIHTLLCI